jgi:hypothetical protein
MPLYLSDFGKPTTEFSNLKETCRTLTICNKGVNIYSSERHISQAYIYTLTALIKP